MALSEGVGNYFPFVFGKCFNVSCTCLRLKVRKFIGFENHHYDIFFRIMDTWLHHAHSGNWYLSSY